MSALARYFRALGKKVAGYDRTPTALTDALKKEKIEVHFEEDISKIPAVPPGGMLVVYTPAIPPGHAELKYLREKGYEVKKRSEVLGMITAESYTVAVAGTHGKTTTSSMIAHILHHSGKKCSAFLGGIANNFDSNLLLPSGGGDEKTVVVVEADEFDRSFLTLHPTIAVITSLDADHLDIYGSREEMAESYRQFASQVKKGGKLIVKKGLDTGQEAVTYSLRPGADYHARNVRIEDYQYVFDVVTPTGALEGLPLGIPGSHNVENAVAAVTVALLLRTNPKKIKEALETYSGVRRRFEFHVRSPHQVYIDDYAHHPEELKACIKSVREMYPGKKITGIFQPHLFSRTRDFADGFGQSLSLLDQLLLLDIYPAREQPIPGVTSQMILDKVEIKNKTLCSVEEALRIIESNEAPGVVLTLGAGDIDRMVAPLKKIIQKKSNPSPTVKTR
jgi:UDP-N-acetylmuramate--alanine ligase